MLASAGESAAGSTQRLPKRSGDNVDSSHHFAILMRAPSSFAEKTGSVRIVDHDHRAIFVREIANRFQIGDGSIHRETTIGGDQFYPGAAGLAQFCFQIRHVVVLVTEASRLAEPNTVDDRGVI